MCVKYQATYTLSTAVALDDVPFSTGRTVRLSPLFKLGLRSAVIIDVADFHGQAHNHRQPNGIKEIHIY